MDPAICILDLRLLKYEWGDQLGAIFEAPHENISLTEEPFEYPYSAVVSDFNRKGFTSLLRDFFKLDPSEMLFDSLDGARERVIDIARRSYNHKTG